MAETQVQKQLKVKTNVVIRTRKELTNYNIELDKQKEKVAKMRADGRDEHDIKKQVEVQGETEVMIPDTMRRLAKAVEDLSSFVAANSADASIAGSEALEAARKLIEEAGGAAAAPAPAPASGGAGAAAAAADEDDRI